MKRRYLTERNLVVVLFVLVLVIFSFAQESTKELQRRHYEVEVVSLDLAPEPDEIAEIPENQEMPGLR
jgi:hypothetical protein